MNPLNPTPSAESRSCYYTSAGTAQATVLAGQLSAASNLSQTFSLQHSPESRHADVIKRFLRKAVAAQSYGMMFSRGAVFQWAGRALPQAEKKFSFTALAQLDQLSAHYLQAVRQRTASLTPPERRLLAKVLDARIVLRHQSNADLVRNGVLTISSHQRLGERKISAGQNTYPKDKLLLANHDFVFFGVEFSDDKHRFPLNTRHNNFDFGANAYMLEARYPCGYLTLTDHLDNLIQPQSGDNQDSLAARFPRANIEICRYVEEEQGRHDVPIFNAKNMRLGLGLHLLQFLRQSRDEAFKAWAFNPGLSGEQLDRLINFIFQPEFHVPRIVSTPLWFEVRWRDIRLEEAVSAANIRCLEQLISERGQANKALLLAISKPRPTVVNYLLERWTFTAQQPPEKEPYGDDLAYILSGPMADPGILNTFIARGLVAVNQVFVTPNKGDTMLDNAIKYGNQSMITLLKRYGALTGKALRGEVEIEG